MAPRIGDLLVREGLITLGDIQEALVLARRESLRLASALVALGRITGDDAARALAQQHGVPAALDRHLDARDLALAELVPAALARELVALPLAVQRGEGGLVVCVRDPSPAVVVQLQEATGRTVVVAVAAEIALRARLDETYPPLDQDFQSVDVDIDPEIDPGAPPANDALDVDRLQLVDLDDHGVEKDHEVSSPRMRLPSFFAVGTEPAVKRPTGPMAVLPPPPPAPPQPEIELPDVLALDDAVAVLAAAADGDAVVDALVAFLRRHFDVGVVFSIKEGLALGQGGFGNDQLAETIASLAIPLGQPSVLRAAFDQKAEFVGPPGDGGVVQDRFFKLWGGAPATVVVAPVVVGTRVVNLVYAHGPRDITLEDAATELGTVVDAAAEAIVRIIKRSKT